MPPRLSARPDAAGAWPLRAVRMLGVGRTTALILTALAAIIGMLAPTVYAQAQKTAAQSQKDASAGRFDQQVLFKASQDGGEAGYACFRIPAVVRTKAGTLLAFAEGRKLNCGDATDIDIVVKRSTDGGKTWSGLSVVSHGDGNTHGNPAPLVDQETGRIYVAQTWNTATADGSSCPVPCDRTPHLQYSDDDGVHWSAERDLSNEILPSDWNSWYATGPGHGIQLQGGKHPGRLVFTVNTETWNGSRVTANHAALIVSDDHGEHWKIGAQDSWPIAEDGTFRQKPSEESAAELANGDIYVSGRETDGTDLGHRDEAVSKDGGDTFAAPFRALPDLYAPQVQGSILNLGHDHLLMAVPADPDRRRTMMIRSSWNGGRTWDPVDRGTKVTDDWSGYSDIVKVDDSTVGLMYEGGASDARDEIRWATFSPEWLAAHQGGYPTTVDRSGNDAPSGDVIGAPATVRGPVGGAMEFNGTSDAVRLPYRDSLPLGTKDFTACLWFRYSATTGTQPMLWMGGVGSDQTQVWVRGDPANKRVMGLITTRNGASAPSSASVAIPSAENDGKWHYLSLRRSGGSLTLAVDGQKVTGPDKPGTVSRTSPFGVHIGQEMDSRVWYKGALDDVRVYDRALSDAELAAVQHGLPSSHGLVFWLPLDRINGPGRS